VADTIGIKEEAALKMLIEKRLQKDALPF